ncbi:YAP-binding/ALF4/Glomulin [Mariannaea sp. PMI_226]|nr:YAP-binding/ALF4/Glomulin [Mariannaea sp. PMI_226]
MSSVDEVIKRLRESRPPASDPFTYLTIVEKSLSPEVLPAFGEILEDAELTKDIGWDLVEMLISIPGSEPCLETIARLGNPREVILKVLEVLDSNSESSEAGDASASAKFITLVGMLTILHRRLKVKAPSRFIHSTLQAVYRAYDPHGAETTAVVIDLVRALSSHKRPPLPTRQSSTKLDTPFQESDPAKSAPDPEAEATESPAESELVNRLLRSFITSILEAYVNSNNMEWASRQIEYLSPERIVPGKPTMLQAFKQIPELQATDALVGQLVAVANDLGLSTLSSDEVKILLQEPVSSNPLSIEPDSEHPETTKLSTGGFLCFIAYRIFASDIFDANYHLPDIAIFPDHHVLLKNFLGEDAQAKIVGNPGTIEALIVMALWLHDQKRLIGSSATSKETGVDFMSYHHLLTLVSVFHPALRVRNAATVLAGLILHADTEEDDRLAILEDLLENCMFSSLQACAVTWLREELILARKAGSKGRFTSPSCLDALQYTLFPDLVYLYDADALELREYWAQNSPFHLQVANFALFLFGGADFKGVAPAGMAAAIEHRYVRPLQATAKTLKDAIEKEEIEAEGTDSEMVMQLDILTDTLERIPLQ